MGILCLALAHFLGAYIIHQPSKKSLKVVCLSLSHTPEHTQKTLGWLANSSQARLDACVGHGFLKTKEILLTDGIFLAYEPERW